MRRSITALLAGALLSGVLTVAAAAQDEVEDEGPHNIPQPIAVLRGLDKTTARVSQIQAKVGKPFTFGNIEVTVRACLARPPEEAPESTAFLEVYEVHPGKQKSKVFTGWVFASTPALNAVEHPVYDVWLIKCRAAAP